MIRAKASSDLLAQLIPELLYSFFQMEFACVTAGILMGGIAERGRLFPAMVFTFLWVTLGEN
jgi:Amt family ammonium transporter